MSSIIEDFKESGKSIIKVQSDVLYSRYDSWDFCYKRFMDISKKKNVNEQDIDNLALNLAFYLASWGMYRGSCFLLQNNYKIHIKPTEMIINFIKENHNKIHKDEILEWNKVGEITDKLISYYESIEFYVEDRKTTGNVTDTLVTKILLGTTGIVPAYDTNVKYCLKKLGMVQAFGEKSYNQINEFYKNNEEIFEEIQRNVNSKVGILYPRMKVLDMCLWEYYKKIKNCR